MLEELYSTANIQLAEDKLDEYQERMHPYSVFIFRYMSLDGDVISKILVDKTSYSDEWIESEREEMQELRDAYEEFMWEHNDDPSLMFPEEVDDE